MIMAFRNYLRPLVSLLNQQARLGYMNSASEISGLASATSLPIARSSIITSQTRSLVSLVVNETSGIGTMTMSSPPVNSITLEFMESFITTLDSAQNNPACKGIILTSGVPRVFSGGLDILTMYKPDEEKARAFGFTFQRLWMDLYLSRLPTIAAINGAAPAGGTILACACDYRIMDNNEKLRMGLNETLLGIVAPWWTVKMFIATVGQREAERALALGKLYSPSEAQKTGLIDEAVDSTEVNATAVAELKKWISIDAGARAATKKLIREPLVDELLNYDRQRDIDAFLGVITNEHTQNVMGAYLAQLQAQAKAKAKSKKG